jgi:hypothetical protein
VLYEAKLARDNFVNRKPTVSGNYDFERSQITATAAIKVTDNIFAQFMEVLIYYKENMEYEFFSKQASAVSHGAKAANRVMKIFSPRGSS